MKEVTCTACQKSLCQFSKSWHFIAPFSGMYHISQKEARAALRPRPLISPIRKSIFWSTYERNESISQTHWGCMANLCKLYKLHHMSSHKQRTLSNGKMRTLTAFIIRIGLGTGQPELDLLRFWIMSLNFHPWSRSRLISIFSFLKHFRAS